MSKRKEAQASGLRDESEAQGAREVLPGVAPATAAAGGRAQGRRDADVAQGRRDVDAAQARGLATAALWLLLVALALGAATYAWFSSSRHTNVTPTAHTVSESGSDLLISSSESGPFGTTCDLAEADKTLYPVSTADLTGFWRSSFQNAAGITVDYASATASVGDYVLSGSVYLQGGSRSLAVYLYPAGMSVSSDAQLLASLRLGLVFEGASGTQTYIFTCDALGDTSGAASTRTTATEGVVVSGDSAWSYVDDPSVAMGAYAMEGSEESPTVASGASPLYTLAAGEVARVRYYVYMEGCDVNCANDAQAKDVALQLAFATAQA